MRSHRKSDIAPSNSRGTIVLAQEWSTGKEKKQ